MGKRKFAKIMVWWVILPAAALTIWIGVFIKINNLARQMDEKAKSNSIKNLENIIESGATIKLDGKTVQPGDIHVEFYADSYFYDDAANTLFITTP